MSEKAIYQRVKELDNIEILSAHFNKQRFSRHAHKNYGICLIEQGAQRFWCSGTNHIADKHSLVLINADEVHDGQAATDAGWTYHACFPDMATFNKLQNEFAGNRALMPWFENVVENDPIAIQLFRNLFSLCKQPNSCLTKETSFYTAMTYIVQRFSRSRCELAELKRHPAAIRFVMDYLNQAYAENISLEALAKAVNLNPFYLSRLFAKHVGMPPHRYQIQVRIHQAMAMLRSNKSISETAIACGFTDQSHLTRHFKVMTGVTPGSFQSAC
jgi:AraC-like DNA-binding protein